MTTLLTPDRTQHAVGQVTLDELVGAPDSFLTGHVRKVLAASGFVMLGFVVVHMAGNLLAFGGPAVFNGYARGLRELGTPLVPENGLLWLVRVALAIALALHLLSHMYIMLHPTVPSALAFSDVTRPWYATLPLIVLQVSGALRRAPSQVRGIRHRLMRGANSRSGSTVDEQQDSGDHTDNREQNAAVRYPQAE